MSVSLQTLFNILFIYSIALLHLSNNHFVCLNLINAYLDALRDWDYRAIYLKPSVLFNLFEAEP
jgi:hypothetical protein